MHTSCCAGSWARDPTPALAWAGPGTRRGLQPPDTAKPAALAGLARRVWGCRGAGDDPVTPGPATTLHFVDDRYETLAAVATSPALGPAVAARRLRLWWADWGYATPSDAAAARADPAVSPLSLAGFIELVTWGLVMGVDDGCEPTAEEVERGVK